MQCYKQCLTPTTNPFPSLVKVMLIPWWVALVPYYLMGFLEVKSGLLIYKRAFCYSLESKYKRSENSATFVATHF